MPSKLVEIVPLSHRQRNWIPVAGDKVLNHSGASSSGGMHPGRYLEQYGAPRSPEELAGHNLLTFGMLGRQITRTFTRESETAFLRVEPHPQINDYLSLQKTTTKGLGSAKCQ